MSRKPPPRDPPVPDPEQAEAPAPREDELEPVATEEDGPADPYDDLWDPDMDTRPERIKRTKARRKPDARSRGRSVPGGKRRDEA